MYHEKQASESVLEISGVSFSAFVVDEDVAVSGSLTEILSATDTNEKSNYEGEDVISEPLVEILQSFCLQN